jgi:radical SAM superfamily enzyme YgiQ (UPF0313 family)
MHGFDVILLTDTSEYPIWFRGTGAHRLANHLRINGYSCLVVDFSSALSFEDWKSICEYAVGDNTKLIGFSTTWWPYRSTTTKSAVVNLNDFGKAAEDANHDYLKSGLTHAAVVGELGEWINVAKQRNKNVKVLVGGPKIDFYKDIPADYFIVGFGETQVIDILKDTKRIWPKFIDHDKNAANKVFDFKCSQILYTDLDFIKPADILTIEFTRGCKFKCSFCSYPLIGRKNVVEESLKNSDVIYKEFMDNYERWGTTKYWVADDTFNDSTEKLEIILSVINRLPFKPEFRAYTRLDVMHSNFEQVSLLKEIGLVNTWIGIDSIHPAASKVIGKGMNSDKKKELIYKVGEKWAGKVNIKAGYILGLPGEDSEFVRKTVDWFLEPSNPVNQLNLNPLRILPPHPGLSHTSRSDIDLNYEKYGYKIPDMNKFWEWTKDDGTDLRSFTETANLCFELTEKIKQRPSMPETFNKTGIQDPQEDYFKPLINALRERK